MNRFTAYRAFDDAGVIQGRLVETGIDELSPGNIVVETAYSSVNYKDALAAAGINRIIRQYPRVTGIDMTGRIVSSDDSALPPGTEVVVHGFGLGVDHDGGHAQYGRFRSGQVMRLPAGLSLLEAATLGVAGYTAALAIDQMELNGLTPDKGPVLVNGATGGVASVAIDILSQRGFEVVAVSGKPESHDYLRAIGATEIINRHELEMGTKPLEKARWAGAVDSVGGPMLSWLTRTMQPDGVIAAFGNAGGADIATTVMPFILRGVRLIGINGNSPMPLRTRVWQRMATDLRAPRLDRIASLAEPQAIAATMKTLLDSAGTGRTVIRFAG